MLKKNMIALSVFTVLVIGAAHATGDRNRLFDTASAASWSDKHGWSRDGDHDFCRDLSGYRLDFAEKFVIVDLDLNRQQMELLGNVKQRISEIADRPDGICSMPPPSQDLMQGMASAKIWLSAAQQALEVMEPSLQAFHASLDDIQKDRLSQWMREGHRERRR